MKNIIMFDSERLLGMLVAFWGAVVVTPTAGIKRTGEFNALCEGYKNIYKSKVNL